MKRFVGRGYCVGFLFLTVRYCFDLVRTELWLCEKLLFVSYINS